MTSEKLTKVCEDLGISAECKFTGIVPKDWPADSRAWKVTLRFGKRRLTSSFYQGSAHTMEPTAADVLSCLASDARSGEETFEGFCGDCGYNQDSRAEKIWKACKKIAPKLRRFLGDSFKRVANAEH